MTICASFQQNVPSRNYEGNNHQTKSFVLFRKTLVNPSVLLPLLQGLYLFLPWWTRGRFTNLSLVFFQDRAPLIVVLGASPPLSPTVKGSDKEPACVALTPYWESARSPGRKDQAQTNAKIWHLRKFSSAAKRALFLRISLNPPGWRLLEKWLSLAMWVAVPCR